MIKEDIDKLLNVYTEYKNIREKQKLRGLNDFNIFTTVLKKSDEVRLHSRFIAYLLNPSANHYQGTLFLDLFLKNINLQNFFTDLSLCKVYREHENIDIYITDDSKHIIIENKIYAADQKGQISRYIETIKESDPELEENDLAVVYLSKDRVSPGKRSLGQWSIVGNYIRRDNNQYRFYSIHYNKAILFWIDGARQQVANITNLAFGLRQYKEVINKLYGKYRGKVMKMEEYIEQYGGDNKVEKIKTIKQISSDYTELRKDYIKRFWDKSLDLLRNKIHEYPNWEIPQPGKNLTKGKKHRFPLRIQQEKAKVVIGFEYRNNDFGHGIMGIIKNDEKTSLKEIEDINDIQLPNGILWDCLKNNTKWWVKCCNYYTGDLLDKILDDGGFEQAAEAFTKKFIQVFKTYKDVVEEYNNYLQEKSRN